MQRRGVFIALLEEAEGTQPVTNTSTGDKQEEKKEKKKPEQPQNKLPEQTKKVYS